MNYGNDPYLQANRGLYPDVIAQNFFRDGDDYGHPCPKPLGLMLWLLNRGSIAGDILDPFMGSGTTLIAAYRHGRSAVGIELSEEYCEMAAKRIEKELAQGRLFCPDEKKPKTGSLFIDENRKGKAQ